MPVAIKVLREKMKNKPVPFSLNKSSLTAALALHQKTKPPTCISSPPTDRRKIQDYYEFPETKNERI
jgi:hypothetical protein